MPIISYQENFKPMQKQITPAALALSALLLTACAAAPVESVATVETAPEPAPQVLTAYAADGLAPALQAYADAQGVAELGRTMPVPPACWRWTTSRTAPPWM